MTKVEELTAAAEGRGCLGRSQDDEPVFVLVARDQTSSGTVRDWARRFLELRMSLGTFDAAAKAKYDEALAAAERMADWRDAHGGGKVPD